MREIITVQSGRLANYSATHFWNAQDAYQTYEDPAITGTALPSIASAPILEHDVHYRAGRDAHGAETYLPRTLIYDLKRNFGSLARVNVLGALAEAGSDGKDSLWGGPLNQLQVAPPSQPSPYALSLLASETPVAPTPATTPFFSDFATTFFHPRSLQPLAPPHPTLDASASGGSQNSSSDLQIKLADTSSTAIPEFTSFTDGARLFASHDAASDVMDNELRPWIEEADSLQAVQLFTSLSDPWAGFSSSYLESIRDELPKTSLWVWGIDDASSGPQSFKTRWRRSLSRAQAVASLASSASLLIPMAVPSNLPNGIRIQRDSPWHVGAVICAGIDSITLPTRLKPSPGASPPSYGDWDDLLRDKGRRSIAALRYGVMSSHYASPENEDRRMKDWVEPEDSAHLEEELDSDLGIDLFPHSASESGKGGRRLGTQVKTFARIDCYRTSQNESIQGPEQGVARNDGLIMKRYLSSVGLPLPLTFPRIFKEISSTSTSIPVHSCLSTNSGIADWVRQLTSPLGMGGSKSLALPVDVSDEDREELRSSLLSIAEAYVEGWESTSEEDYNMDETE